MQLMKDFFHICDFGCSIESRARDHPVNYTWFENACREHERQVMCSGNVKVYWNEKEKQKRA